VLLLDARRSWPWPRRYEQRFLILPQRENSTLPYASVAAGSRQPWPSPAPIPTCHDGEKAGARASLGRQRIAECGVAESFVLRRNACQSLRTLSTIARQRVVFFTATARSIVLGWISRSNFFGSVRPAGALEWARLDPLLLDELEHRASHLVRALRTPFPGHQPAIPASSKLALVW